MTDEAPPRRPASPAREQRIATETRMRLALFVRTVEAGETPSREALELVAAGVDRLLDGLTPWPQPPGRRRKMNTWPGRIEAAKVRLLRRARVKPEDVARAIGLPHRPGDALKTYVSRASAAGRDILGERRLAAGTAGDGVLAFALEAIDAALVDLGQLENAGAARDRLSDMRARWITAHAERDRCDEMGSFVK